MFIHKKCAVLAMLLATTGFVATAHHAIAQETPSPLKIGVDVKGQYLFDGNRDLGTGIISPASSRTLETRIKVDYTPTDILKFFMEGNLVKVWGDASGEDETGTSQGAGRYAELRQYYFKVNNVFNALPMYVQVGRQRFSDPYAFMWNRDIDAVRFGYDGSLVNGFVAFGENMASYKTAEDDFDADTQDIGRMFGEVTWDYAYKKSLTARMLHIHDHSGTNPIGYVFAPKARDDEDAKLTWTDLRATGRIPAMPNIMSDINYRADGAVVMGDATTVTSTAVAPTSDLRRVTAVNARDVMGWAFDGDINMTLALPLAPTLVFGYAYGSGDDGRGQDTSFHQPDLRGNSSRQGDSTGASHNYGEALRPDLTNLHIVKAGIGFPVMKASDIMMTYRYYLLDHKETGLSNAHVSASVAGTSHSLGQGLDLIYNMKLNEEFPVMQNLPADTALKISLGAFKSGDAYGVANDEDSFRGTVDLKLSF